VPFVRQLPNLERLHDKLTLQKANTQYLSYGGQPSTIATLQEHGFAIYFRPLFSSLTTARRHHPKNGIILNMCGNSEQKKEMQLAGICMGVDLFLLYGFP